MTEPRLVTRDGTLILDRPVDLPAVLDLLIIGAGPAGTALAFRAKELGLSALVIDRDDVLTRIRDYTKNKPILPDFGGGDTMTFPDGGPLIAQLHFSAIDKDDMHRLWKSSYVKNNIPAQIGVDLLGLKAENDGIWRATAWNTNTRSEQSFAARHVALALGGGIPRRLDIPGDVTAIATRLNDASSYVGAPVCVIGGGSSAAEAVIAISQAKSKAADNAPVCWAYRGTKMPTVSKALADVLFTAYVEGGNIRYLPASEPIALMARPHGMVLCVEVDRKEMPNRPVEAVQLEFLAHHCVACIGQEIPAQFLAALDIRPVTGGPRNRKAMAVTPLLETSRRNVYLLGDILSPIYLETDDFTADPSALREIKRRGNVKAALRDGVLVADVVAQKLAGRTKIHVDLNAAAGAGAQGPRSDPRRAQPPAAGQPAALIRLLPDGVEAEVLELNPSGTTTIGREGCDIAFPSDTLMSERHASISRAPHGYTLQDDDSRRGVLLQIADSKATVIRPDSIVHAGNQWLLFESDGEGAAFTQYDHHGTKLNRHPLSEGTIVVGREAPDITLDPDDPMLSRRHLSVTLKSGMILIRDLKTVNGTYLRVRPRRLLEDGDEIRLGSQLLRFSLSREVRPPTKVDFDTGQTPVIPSGDKAGAPPAGVAAAGRSGVLEVLFKNSGKKCAFKTGESVCETAEANGVKIRAQCHEGICGSDPIRVVAGRENLNAITEGEAGTLEDICGVAPGEYRLACVTRPTGPVVVEVVDG